MLKKLFFSLSIIFSLSYAQESTLKLGLGIGSLYYPDYIGSKSFNLLTLPFPYIIYKGKYFHLDKEGLHKQLLGLKNLELDLSLSGSLPANSEKNDLRADMPDLLTTFEIGPKLKYRFYNTEQFELSFVLPFRAVFSTDITQTNAEGYIISPTLRADMYYKNIHLKYKTLLIYADTEYNNYFYEVSKKYITTQRKEYYSKSGYGGFNNRLSLSYEDGNLWYGAFISYYDLDSAVFVDSPLIETRRSFFTAVSMAYFFYSN